MSTHNSKSSTGPPSPTPLYLTFNSDPSTPTYETVQVTLANGRTTQGRACEICGRVIVIGSKGSLHAFNTHKTACEQKRGSSGTPYSTKSGNRTRSLSVAPSMASLSPLMIPSPSLSPSLPGSPTSPLYSPILSPVNSPLYVASNSEDHGTPTDPGSPLITVNPPSDDPGPLHISLPQALPVTCTGITVQWTPGTIWETYPFASHSFVRHPWQILKVCPPGHLRLHSAHCTSMVSMGGFKSVCHDCLRIPKSEGFQTIQKRAEGASPHTPHRFLSFQQLSAIPKKMTRLLDQARIKVLKSGIVNTSN